jgi:glyoxylase-like metal-dependent hydrolase (beta-lactamase superfamily II)
LVRLLKVVVVVVLLAVAIVAGGLAWLHWEIQLARDPLPLLSDVLAVGAGVEGPVKLSVIETSQQQTPRSGVIDPAGDPHKDTPFVMTHPAFVLEWADGRILLVDTGMTREGAIRFGVPFEQFFHAGPAEALTSAAAALGDAAARINGIVFTHLHLDHVEGLSELCPRIGHPAKIFMTALQQDSWTPFTAEGKSIVEKAPCGERVRLGGPPLKALEGFPGVGVVSVGGHTPGSQAILAAIRTADGTLFRYIFTGDVTNTIDGIRSDVPKPLFYRLVIVPEDDERLGELRRYFGTLEREHGFKLVVSHDQAHLRELGIPAWKP